MLNLLRRTKEGSSVAVLALTAVLTLGGLVAAAPANAAGPVGSSAAMVVADTSASISGRVTAVSSTGGLFGLADVYVSAFSDSSWDGTMTDSSGNYTITGLNPGDYEVEFWDFSDTRTSPYADTHKAITIGTSGDVVLDVTMARGSTVAGTLTQTVAGVVSPAVDIDVTVYDLDGFPVGWWSTDDEGKYRVPALAAGTYKVGFGMYGSATGLLPEYYNDVYTLAAAKSLVVGTAAAVTGINAQLSAVPHVNAVTPTITGTKKVGYALTAVPGTWGPGTVTFKYQWYRAGVAITGATLKTYMLTGSDAGKAISVKVMGSRTGYTSLTKTSAATAAIAAGLTAPTPTITGTKKSGYTLTAIPGTWGPGTVTLKYQWYRSGVAISGGTAKTYKLVSADRYDTIKVRVLGVKTGYADVAKYSASTVKIP